MSNKNNNKNNKKNNNKNEKNNNKINFPYDNIIINLKDQFKKTMCDIIDDMSDEEFAIFCLEFDHFFNDDEEDDGNLNFIDDDSLPF